MNNINRKVIAAQAETTLAAQMLPLPDRFKDIAGPISNCRRITDMKTGRSIIVNLNEYRSMRRFLYAFFK